MVARARLLRLIRFWGAFCLLIGFYGVLAPLVLRALGMRTAWVGQVLRWGLAATMAFVILALATTFVAHRRAIRLNEEFHRRLEEEGETVLLLPRPDAPPVTVSQVGLWARLAEIIPKDEHIAFELSGGALGVAFSIRATEGVARSIITQIMAEWPGTRVQRVERQEEDPLSPAYRDREEEKEARPIRHAWWVEIAPASTEAPIEPNVPDPLMALLTEISRLPEGVRGGLQVLARGDPFTRRRLGRKAARLTAQRSAGKSLEQKRGEKGLDQRAQRLFLEVRVLVWASAGTEEMARSVARSLARTLMAQFGPSNPLQQLAEGSGVPAAREFPLFGGRPWADNEISSIAHLVGRDGRGIAPQLKVAPAKPLPPSPESRVPPGARTVRRAAV